MISGRPKLIEHDAKLEEWMKDLNQNKEKQKLIVMPLFPVHPSLITKQELEKRTENFDLNSIIGPAIYNHRQQANIQLQFTNALLELVQSRIIQIPDKTLLKLRDQWNLTEPEVRKKILDFKESLEQAVHHYNKQLVLLQLAQAKKRDSAAQNLTNKTPWNWKKYGLDIPLEDQKTVHELSDEYYEKGNQTRKIVAQHYEQLLNHPLAKQFLLTPKEIKQEMLEQVRNAQPKT